MEQNTLHILHLTMQILFYGYILFIILKYGVQTSISESYYKLPTNLQWIFTLVTWGYAACAIIIGLDTTGSEWVFVSGVGILFVGASPAFHTKDNKRTLENEVHIIGAGVGIIGLFLFLTMVLNLWYITIAFVILSSLTYIWKPTRVNSLWWIELYAFLSLDISYITILF